MDWKREGREMDPRYNMRKSELMALARQQNIEIPDGATKDDILRLMNVIPENEPEVLGMGPEPETVPHPLIEADEETDDEDE